MKILSLALEYTYLNWKTFAFGFCFCSMDQLYYELGVIKYEVGNGAFL